MIENELKNYGKADIRGSRWIQIYARRPLREVYYLGIDKCVPIIESEKNNIQYETSSVSNDLITNILHYASYILNKPYTSFNQHQQPNGKILIELSQGTGLLIIEYERRRAKDIFNSGNNIESGQERLNIN